mmetsp:Transcript_6864/g.11380  ORF Transcript_6864/g.11380 Transcript_6864/m.11380 type:complete len:352 (+) Transcript_6864:62-1117(+)
MPVVFKASPHWRSTKRKNRRQMEEQNLWFSWIFGLFVWLLIGLTVYNSVPDKVREPSEKDLKSMEIVGLKLERLMSNFDHRADLMLRLRTSGNQPWSAENPLDRALYWLAIEDDDNRLTLERYALAVLYYYTSQLESWKECAPRSKDCTTTPVLTTSTSECDWYGITCSPDNRVTRVEWTSNNLSSSSRSAWPEEIILLQELELLWWSDNPLLETSIPSFLVQLTDLQSLSLHHTKLQGSLPDEIYRLTNLISLRIYETQLTGSLSSSIGQLSKLNWLWLHGNRMKGQLPQELADLTKLEGLTLHHNSFANEPPQGLCDLRHDGTLETYWTDCLSDDPPSCSCCSKCFDKK